MPENTEIQKKVEINLPTPILDVIDSSLARLFKKNLAELVDDTNRAIERGVKADETAREAEIIVQDSRKAIRIVTEIRMQFTRPIDEGKKRLIREVGDLLRPLVDANTTLDNLVMERATKIREAEEEARRKAEEEQRVAEEVARKEEERRRNISLAQGGDGTFKPVEVEKPIQPVSQIGMRSTTRTKSIPDRDAIRAAVDSGTREIPGVRIFQVWEFDVVDSKAVPDVYRKLIRG